MAHVTLSMEGYYGLPPSSGYHKLCSPITVRMSVRGGYISHFTPFSPKYVISANECAHADLERLSRNESHNHDTECFIP